VPRESAEEKIARIVRDTLKGERDREDEAKNPGWAKIRQIIREEIAGAQGPKGGRRQAADEDQDEDQDRTDGGLLEALGLK
jgi:hypothetical protein